MIRRLAGAFTPGQATRSRRIGALLLAVVGVLALAIGGKALARQEPPEAIAPIGDPSDLAGVVTVDSYGCAPRADRQVDRPPANGGLKAVGEVSAVSVCRYSIQGVAIAPDGGTDDIRFARLQASSRLTGNVARHLVRDLVAAPQGVGPTIADRRGCRPDPGHEFLILRVQGSDGTQDVFYRYDTCHHNGTDDSSTLRQLTADTARQLFIGVHQLAASYPALDHLLIGTPPPVR